METFTKLFNVDEQLQTVLDAEKKRQEKLSEIDNFFKLSKFTNPYGKGGILDSEKWVKETFTLEQIKNEETVTKTVKVYDCYKSEQYAIRLAYQVTMIKIKAACGFYDKKATTRFDALTYKLYCQRAYLLRLIAAYDDGDISSLAPMNDKNNAYTDMQVFDLLQEAITHIYTCMAEGLDVAEIYNSALNELNKYIYKQSAHKGGIVNESGKQHRKYTIVSLDEIQVYIADVDSEELESGILPQINDAAEDDYYTIVDSCIQFDTKMRRDLYRKTKEKFFSTVAKKNKTRDTIILKFFVSGISKRQASIMLKEKKYDVSDSNVLKIYKKIKACGLQAFKELYPSLYDIFTCTDKKQRTDLSRILSQNHGVSNKTQFSVKTEIDFIDYIIHKWNNVG